MSEKTKKKPDTSNDKLLLIELQNGLVLGDLVREYLNKWRHPTLENISFINGKIIGGSINPEIKNDLNAVHTTYFFAGIYAGLNHSKNIIQKLITEEEFNTMVDDINKKENNPMSRKEASKNFG